MIWWNILGVLWLVYGFGVGIWFMADCLYAWSKSDGYLTLMPVIKAFVRAWLWPCILVRILIR